MDDGWIAFHTWPHGLSECRPEFANSDRFVLPMMIAPAARILPTWNASFSGWKPSNTSEPCVIGMSLVS